MNNRLLAPARLGPYCLPSRMIMAPMTRNRSGDDGIPSSAMATYYAQRAGAALIITEATQVSPEGIGYPRTPGIHTHEQVAAWRRITGAVHRRGGRMFLQVCHAGRVSHPSLQPGRRLPVAPSPIAPSGEAMTREGRRPFVTPRELAPREIAALVEQFRSAAEHALAAEFDGVEIHAASGYLIDQFLRDGSNLRGDEYGGSATNRVRLLAEIVEGVTSVWGGDRIGVRLSPLDAFNSMFDLNPEETFGTAVTRLNDFPLAYLHVMERDDSPAAGPCFDIHALHRLWRGPYVVNGGYDFSLAEQTIAEGRADFVSFGRLFLANPDLPVRFARASPLNEPDRATFYGGDDRGYVDYPTLDGVDG